MLHSAWATPAFIEVRAGEYSKNRDGRDNRPLAGRGQRGAIRLCPEPSQSGKSYMPEKEERRKYFEGTDTAAPSHLEIW